MRKPFEISTGAWWVVADGRTIAVPSFHESWLASHPGIASGALHTIDFVEKSGWLSVTLYSEGLIEVISRDILDNRQREALRQLLETNRSIIRKMVLFVPSIDGCFTAEDLLLDDWERLWKEIETFAAKEIRQNLSEEGMEVDTGQP
ncbi:MAG TPA: hypothetical protein PK105_00180 [Rectinema sp.]|nr:hypothetical protein [Rectinema sp.]